MSGSKPGLLISLLAYAAASLLHHVHNAEFLSEYPNMPAWLTPAGVYLAWLATTAVGLVGYVLMRRGHRMSGLAVLGAYGALGLFGLGHYTAAPFSAHSPAMHLTIWTEVVTGALLMIAVSGQMLTRFKELRR